MNHGLTLIVPFFSFVQTAAAAKSLQSCPTLCDPIDGSPPGSPGPRTSFREFEEAGLGTYT